VETPVPIAGTVTLGREGRIGITLTQVAEFSIPALAGAAKAKVSEITRATNRIDPPRPGSP
jgi:hypothetical protein